MAVVNLSFAASGFMGIYHLGAVRAILRHGDKLLGSLQACTGASSGALVAAVVITAPDKLEVEKQTFAVQKYKKCIYHLSLTVLLLFTPLYTLHKLRISPFLAALCRLHLQVRRQCAAAALWSHHTGIQLHACITVNWLNHHICLISWLREISLMRAKLRMHTAQNMLFK